MANVIINDTHLTDIADAIREKNGTADTYKPSEMAAAITSLVTGGGGGGSWAKVAITATVADNIQSYDISSYVTEGNNNWMLLFYGTYNTTSTNASEIDNVMMVPFINELISKPIYSLLYLDEAGTRNVSSGITTIGGYGNSWGGYARSEHTNYANGIVTFDASDSSYKLSIKAMLVYQQ